MPELSKNAPQIVQLKIRLHQWPGDAPSFANNALDSLGLQVSRASVLCVWGNCFGGVSSRQHMEKTPTISKRGFAIVHVRAARFDIELGTHWNFNVCHTWCTSCSSEQLPPDDRNLSKQEWAFKCSTTLTDTQPLLILPMACIYSMYVELELNLGGDCRTH